MLKVDLAIDPALDSALKSFKTATDQRALFIGIDGETLKLTKPVVQKGEMSKDLADIRSAIKELAAAFILLRLDNAAVRLVTFTPEGTKPKIRMMFASSSARLRDATGMSVPADIHVGAADELIEDLFKVASAADKRALMPVEERQRLDAAAAADKEQKTLIDEANKRGATGAVRGTPMQAIGSKVSAEVIEAAKAIVLGSRIAVVIAVENGVAVVDAHAEEKGAATTKDHTAVKEMFLAGAPRFAIVKWAEKIIFLYVCPETSKPKERMSYAAGKAKVRDTIIEESGIEVTKNVEIGSVGDDFVTEINASLVELTEEDVASAAAPGDEKVPLYKRGPRMCM